MYIYIKLHIHIYIYIYNLVQTKKEWPVAQQVMDPEIPTLCIHVILSLTVGRICHDQNYIMECEKQYMCDLQKLKH